MLGGRGETPGAIEDDAYCEAKFVGVKQGLKVVIGERHVLCTDPFQPEVGMLCAEVAGPLQRRVGQVVQRERGELRIDRPLRRRGVPGPGDPGAAAGFRPGDGALWVGVPPGEPGDPARLSTTIGNLPDMRADLPGR